MKGAKNNGCGDVDLTLEGALPVRHTFIHFPVDEGDEGREG